MEVLNKFIHGILKQNQQTYKTYNLNHEGKISEALGSIATFKLAWMVLGSLIPYAHCVAEKLEMFHIVCEHDAISEDSRWYFPKTHNMCPF